MLRESSRGAYGKVKRVRLGTAAARRPHDQTAPGLCDTEAARRTPRFEWSGARRRAV